MLRKFPAWCSTGICNFGWFPSYYALTEDDFDADYLHNNLDKLLTTASDIRKLYDDAIVYIKRRSNEPEFENAYTMTKDLVNNLLAVVRNLVGLDDRSMATMERNQVDYVEKYKLQDVD